MLFAILKCSMLQIYFPTINIFLDAALKWAIIIPIKQMNYYKFIISSVVFIIILPQAQYPCGCNGSWWKHCMDMKLETVVGLAWIAPDPWVLRPSKWTGPNDRMHFFYFINCWNLWALDEGFREVRWTPNLVHMEDPPKSFDPLPIPRWAPQKGAQVFPLYILF